MKKIHIIIILFMSIILGTGCSDSEDNNEIFAIGPLQNLIAISGEKQITLSWDNPENQELSYVEIIYSIITSSETKIVQHEVKGEKSSQLTIAVPEGKDVYKFLLTAYNISGGKSAPQEVKGKPYTSDTELGMDALLSDMKIEAIANGAKFSWNNPNNISCMIKIAYSDKEGNKEVSFDARRAIPSTSIKLTSGVTFKVSVIGVDESSGVSASTTREVTIEPNKPYKLSTETWNVVAFSSQAAIEGNGSAVCAIDGTPLTRWQSIQKNNADWIIIDMGSPVIIDRFALARYFGVADNSAWDVTFFAGNEPNPAVWEYEYSYNNKLEGIFKMEFDRTKDGDQIYLLPEPITARYFKYRTDRISASWATHYGEISVYGYYVE